MTLSRKTPLRATAFVRRLPLSPSRVGSDTPKAYRKPQGRSARKRASDAAVAQLRPLLEARADGLDEITGEPFGVHGPHMHHRRKRGGPEHDTLANTILINSATHGWVHQEVAHSRRFGWIVPTWKHAEHTPVLYRGEWAYLAEDGRILPAANPHKGASDD